MMYSIGIIKISCEVWNYSLHLVQLLLLGMNNMAIKEVHEVEFHRPWSSSANPQWNKKNAVVGKAVLVIDLLFAREALKVYQFLEPRYDFAIALVWLSAFQRLE